MFYLAGFKKTIDYLNGDVFSSSEAYERAIGVLEVHHCITIIGPPGSGKTITAGKLAYRKCGLSKMYFCQTVEEILDKANKNKGVCIIVDDWIDEYVSYPFKINTAVDLLSSVYNRFVQSGEVYLILTAQEDIWSRLKGSLKSCGLFQRQSLLKIQFKKITKKEKQNVIHRHFKHFNIKENSFTQNNSRDKFAAKLVKLENELEFSFPVMIDLICANERLQLERTLPLILKDGFSRILHTFFDNWLTEGDINQNRSFSILVFAAFLGGKVSLADFKSTITGSLFHKVCNKYKCSFSAKTELNQSKPSEREIEMLLLENKRLRSCLYQIICGQNDTIYIFRHSSLFRFVLSYLRDKEEVFFIENVCLEVLIKQCLIEEGFTDQACSPLKQPVGSVRLSTSVLKLLAERIYHEKEQGYHIPEWDDHIFMRHRTFKEMWNKIDLAKSSCSIDK